MTPCEGLRLAVKGKSKTEILNNFRKNNGILYDLECEDDIILYFNNDKLEESDRKLCDIFNKEEKEIRLDIECKEYTEREILEIFYHVTDGPNWNNNTGNNNNNNDKYIYSYSVII